MTRRSSPPSAAADSWGGGMVKGEAGGVSHPGAGGHTSELS